MTAARTLPSLRRSRLAETPSAPLLTWYDLATGERVELSHRTFDGWVAKTAGLLRDVVGLGPGATVAIDLPLHWLLAVQLAACAELGAEARVGGDPAEADLAVCGPDGVAAALAAPEVLAVSLLPMAMPFRTPLPTGAEDYCLEVRSSPDRFDPSWPVLPDDPAWRLGEVVMTQGRAVAEAGAVAARVGAGPGARVLTTRAPLDADGLLALLALPLVTAGSVVAVRGGTDDDALARIGAEEGVTARV